MKMIWSIGAIHNNSWQVCFNQGTEAGGGVMWATRSAPPPPQVILFLLRAWVGPSRRGSLRLNIVEIV